jgi:hypothetical protein
MISELERCHEHLIQADWLGSEDGPQAAFRSLTQGAPWTTAMVDLPSAATPEQSLARGVFSALPLIAAGWSPSSLRFRGLSFA